MKSNNKYDIIYLSNQEQIKRKNDMPFSSLGIIGDNTNKSENIIRSRCLNNIIFQMEYEEVIDLLKKKINEFKIDLENYKIINIEDNNDIKKKDIENNPNKNDIEIYLGYNLHQFLLGTFLDCLSYIYNEIEPDKSNEHLDEIILICLDIFIFILETIKANLNKIKIFINNRKLLILDNIYAILASFELILANIDFIFSDNFSKNEIIMEKKSNIINICYQLILNNNNNYCIPVSILVQLIQFITMNNKTKKSIIKFQQTAIFKVYLSSIENLTESEIKNIKNLNKFKDYSNSHKWIIYSKK